MSINSDWITARIADAAAKPFADPHGAVIRLRELLERCALEFADLRTEKIPSAVVRPRRGLHPDEASAFLGAVDQGLAVEAKARITGPDSLEKLLRAWLDYNQAGGRAPATNAGRKYTELRRLCESGPVTVWLVAAGARWCLQATWEASGIIFTASQPPMYQSAEGATACGRRMLWSRPYDSSLHGAATRGAAGRCSWSCEEPPVWSTRVRELAGTESTFALCEAHHRRVEDVYCG